LASGFPETLMVTLMTRVVTPHTFTLPRVNLSTSAKPSVVIELLRTPYKYKHTQLLHKIHTHAFKLRAKMLLQMIIAESKTSGYIILMHMCRGNVLNYHK